MVPDTVRTASERLTVRHILSLAAFLVIIYGVTRELDVVIGATVGLAVLEAVAVLRETPSVADRWIQLGIGGFVSLASVGWLAYELVSLTRFFYDYGPANESDYVDARLTRYPGY